MSHRFASIATCVLFLVASTLLAATGELSYRGRIARVDGRPFDGTTTCTALFTVGGTKGAEVWRAQVSVLPSKEGLYQVLLSDRMEGVFPDNPTTLSSLLEEGAAQTVSVSIDGNPDFYPVQRILTVPLADRATAADGLAPDARASAAKADSVVAGSASLANARISEKVEITEGDGSLTIDVWNLDGTGTIEAGSACRFFRQASADHSYFRTMTRDIDTRTDLVGPLTSDAVLKVKDIIHGGVLVLVSEDNWTLPAVSLLVPGGNYPFRSPVECSGTVTLYFYPFGK